MSVIVGAAVDIVIVIISILLVKKIKPNKSNLLNLSFGTFWLGAAAAYFFAAVSDLSGLFASVYLSKLFFVITIVLAAIPVFSIALFLSATSLKGKSVWILPSISALIGLVYIYFIITAVLVGPFIGWTLKYLVQSEFVLVATQYGAYFSFIMVALLGLIAFKARKTSTFIQFNSVAVSMGLFFFGGYLDLIGNPELGTVLIRTLVMLGAVIGYIGFSPGIRLMKFVHRLS